MKIKEPVSGIAGKLSSAFIHSRLTPLIAVLSLLLGWGSVWMTPKEEEPQISVPMIDISTDAPGFEAPEVEREVTEPIERAVWGLDGVEYVYSASQAHHSMVTVRFRVGEPMEPSLVKVHHKLLSIRNELPASARSSEVRSFSIDDVPFLILTFSSPSRDDYSLRTLAAPLARELSSTPDLSRVEMLGGEKRAVRVVVQPDWLASRGVTLREVAEALRRNDIFAPAGKTWGADAIYDVEAGKRPATAEDIGNIPVGQKGGRVIQVRDVARITDGPEAPTRASILLDRQSGGLPERAVSIVFAKRKGTDVTLLASQLIDRARLFSKALPSDIHMTVNRNFGQTASEKSRELIEHLVLATLSVTLLIAIMMGIRASLVVGLAIPVTLSLTLLIYYFLGYTLNRVTLFALIFSIGILVDDAIVVVENIERHLKTSAGENVTRKVISAVSEVGNPTLLATFAVIASILPMAFVRGMMGPYMKPIPVGASLAMILSVLVAFILTPWAAVRLIKPAHGRPETGSKPPAEGWLDRLYRAVSERLLRKKSASAAFGLIILLLFLLSGSLLYFKSVKVKMLPFDNKNEFQVLIDYPSTTPLEEGKKRSVELAHTLLANPDVERVVVYAGEAAPFSFSGMVKHTYLRHLDASNDLQVVLKDRTERKEPSHRIIQSLRPMIADFAKSNNAVARVLEVPPGPPVQATLVAEIYGPDRVTREKTAREVFRVFSEEPSVVDLDTSLRPGRPRKIYPYDLAEGGLLGTRSDQAVETGRLIFSESSLLYLDDHSSPEEVSIDLSVAPEIRGGKYPFQGESLSTLESGMAPLSRVMLPPVIREEETLYRKNLRHVVYITSELAGAEEAPVYGILKLAPKIHFPTQTAEVPWNNQQPVVKWDGEWFITYEVFRDLGIAFAAVILLIYVLVVGWFKSFSVPLVIMAPIPISLIGILPGHAVTGAFFTATSMIGFIAGGGIIVRNSIILVDFIEQQIGHGVSLKEAVISAGILRFRPMLLTAAAVIVGSSVILFDPIFQGLAVSLIFGEIAATALSRLAVPVLYYWFIGKSRVKFIQSQIKGETNENY